MRVDIALSRAARFERASGHDGRQRVENMKLCLRLKVRPAAACPEKRGAAKAGTVWTVSLLHVDGPSRRGGTYDAVSD